MIGKIGQTIHNLISNIKIFKLLLSFRNFLMAVCSIGVSDVKSIPKNVFSSAFKIFDQVTEVVK